MTEEIRGYQIEVPDADLADLHDRLNRVRFPEAETVSDWSQGPPLAYVTELVRYWARDYDWRRVEAELNAHGSALTEIDGLDVHFLHVRSPRPDARPLVITHGWPSSIIEPMTVIAELTNPASPDTPAFHVVAPSLPGYGFSGRPDRTGWTVDHTADAWAELMSRLGYDRFFAAGGDWGGRVTTALANRHPDRVAALWTFSPYVREPADGPGELTEIEDAGVADLRRFIKYGSAYSLQHSTRPQALGYALVDSPVGLLGWILDKFYRWTDHTGRLADAVSRDRILDTVTLYWLTETGASSVRFYWQNYPPADSAPVSTPTAVTTFPADIERLPRGWVERRFHTITHWSLAERGGHFPMLEVPASVAHELQQSLGHLPL